MLKVTLFPLYPQGLSIGSENRHHLLVRLDLNGNIVVASRWRERDVDSLQNYPTRCKICLMMEF